MRTRDVSIRLAELRDHPVLSALMLRLDFTHREFDKMELSVEQFESIIVSEHDAMLLTDDGTGFVHASDDSSPHATAPHQMYINNLYVLSDRRRKGIGTELMNAAFAWGRKCGMASVRLHVWSENVAAREFYLALGFEQVADGLEREL